jgi:pyrroline-5-carboxylate reductase
MAESDIRIGFVGAGKMATALAKGFAFAGVARADRMIASDVAPESRRQFTAETSARGSESNVEVARNCDVLFIAVKPQHMKKVLVELHSHVSPEQLVVSIAAGVTLETLQQGLGRDKRLVRVMPNTPCLVGASAAGYSLGGQAGTEDAAVIERLLSAVGVAVRLPESLLDAVTGLSGSGPAYGFVMIEALADGGVRMGLPRDVSLKLAAQTLLGAAKMVLDTGGHPAALKDAVASPGGTTIAGLHALERGGVRSALMNAVEAATLRSRELAHG